MNKTGERGINEVLATIRLAALIVALAIVILSIAFGWVVIQPKSAFIPPRVEVVDVNGQQAISLTSKGGDPAVLWPGESGAYALSIYLDVPGGAVPVIPDSGVETFYPGQTLYIYNSSLGLRAAYNLAGKTLSPLPSGPITLRVIDENAKLLVFSAGLALQDGGPTEPEPCTPGTGWIIRNKQDSAFQYLLRVESSGEIISQGVINPKKVIYLWYPKQSPYTAILSWNSAPPNTDKKENTLDLCEFTRYETDFPGGGEGQPRPLQLLAMGG